MILLLILNPRFHRAVARDLRNAMGAAILGPRCAVTGEHTHPKDRARHESDNHPGEGTCA